VEFAVAQLKFKAEFADKASVAALVCDVVSWVDWVDVTAEQLVVATPVNDIVLETVERR
jgi:hypothetical protein